MVDRHSVKWQRPCYSSRNNSLPRLHFQSLWASQKPFDRSILFQPSQLSLGLPFPRTTLAPLWRTFSPWIHCGDYNPCAPMESNSFMFWKPESVQHLNRYPRILLYHARMPLKIIWIAVCSSCTTLRWPCKTNPKNS